MSPNATDSPDLGAFFAEQVRGLSVSEKDLATAISDIVIETTTQGASTLKVEMTDSDWDLLTSGWLDTDENGKLQTIRVEFPQGSRFFWNVCTVEATTDSGRPNLTLTFEDSIVNSLRNFFGRKKATRGPSMTRAEFIRSLSREVAAIVFHCPELRVEQPIQIDPQLEETASTTVGQAFANQTVTNPAKLKGIHKSVEVTVKGFPAKPVQLKAIEDSLSVADGLKAPEIAVVAMICAGTGESAFFASQVSPKGYKGVYQANPANVPQFDTAAQAHYFLKGGKGFQSGGAIQLANAGETSPGVIATKVEAGGAAPNFYGNWEKEARRTIAAYGGAGGLSAESSTPSLAVSGTYAFTRGTTEDPDEDSWTCMNRLAQEVNWSLFTNGHGLYYFDGSDLIGQKPSAVIDRKDPEVLRLEFTFDDTAYQNSTTKTADGKKKRGTALARADTPTEGKLTLICGIDDYRAGEVFVLKSCGTANGRWIVTDATRSVFSPFTEFTLSPPTAPIPEPAPEQKDVTADELAKTGGETAGTSLDGSGVTISGGSQADLVAFLKTSPTPKEIIDRFFIPIGAHEGATCPVGALTPANVVRANAQHGPTVNGTPSDHQGPPNHAWAADQDIGGDIRYGNHAGALKGDRIAKAEAALLGVTWQGSGIQNIPLRGYRFQLIWRTTNGGNHFNHVHVGVRRL